MNPRLVATALGAILVILVIGWEITLVRWQKKGHRGSELRRRQRRVRKVAAVIVFVLFAIATVSWRLLASERVGPGRGIYLVPLASIVCLVGVIAVRGLWFLTSAFPRFHWLHSVSNRVSLEAGIIVTVSVITANDMTRVIPSSGASMESNQLFFFFLGVFIFLTSMVALASLVLERQLPDTADMLDLVIGLEDSQTAIDEKRRDAVKALNVTSQLVSELERSLIEQNKQFNDLQSAKQKLSNVTYKEGEAVVGLLEEVLEKKKNPWGTFLNNVGAGFVTGLVFFLAGLLVIPSVRHYLKQFLGL